MSKLTPSDNEMPHADDSHEGYFFVKHRKKLEKVWESEVIYIQGMGNYLAIYTTSKKIVTYGSLKVLGERLASLNLIIIHKSYRVPLHRIEGMTGKTVILDKTELPLSKNYKGNLKKILERQRII